MDQNSHTSKKKLRAPPSYYDDVHREMWYEALEGIDEVFFSMPTHYWILEIIVDMMCRYREMTQDPNSSQNTMNNLVSQILKAKQSLRVDNSLISPKNNITMGNAKSMAGNILTNLNTEFNPESKTAH